MKLRRIGVPSLALILLIAIAACLPLAGAGAQPAKPFRILVSNDDGVRAPGILAVAQALQPLGEVTIVAPAENQSGKGHSITIAEPIFRDDVTLAGGLRATSLTATPASTVKVALARIVKEKPDLVVSGINRGSNLGWSAYLSGTVGAAREATTQGIPSIAASLVGRGDDVAAYAAASDAVARIVRYVKEHGLPAGVFLNVNVPSGPPGSLKGYRVTTQVRSAGGKEGFEERKHPNGRIYYWNVFVEGGPAPDGTDMWAVEQGFVSITPLRIPEYDPQAAEQLKTLATAVAR